MHFLFQWAYPLLIQRVTMPGVLGGGRIVKSFDTTCGEGREGSDRRGRATNPPVSAKPDLDPFDCELAWDELDDAERAALLARIDPDDGA